MEHEAQALAEYRGVKARHAARIRALLIEMRWTNKIAEGARDTYYAIANKYKLEKRLSGIELDKAMENNYQVKGAIADSELYDRWATKYGAMITAEIAAYNQGIHADNWEDETL